MPLPSLGKMPRRIRMMRVFLPLVAVVVALLGATCALAGPPAFDQAVASYKAGRYSQALSQFQTITAPDALTHYYMGMCYQCLNQVARAKQEYEWVSAYSRDPGLRANAQTGLSRLGQYQQTRNYQGQGNSFSRSAGGGRPRVIDFYTTWCGPCKRLAPILADVESGFRGQVSFERLDCEAAENSQTVARFGINAYPTVVFLNSGGSEVNRMVGLYDKGAYVSAVQSLVGQ